MRWYHYATFTIYMTLCAPYSCAVAVNFHCSYITQLLFTRTLRCTRTTYARTHMHAIGKISDSDMGRSL